MAKTQKKILILHTAFLGDLILLSSLFRLVRMKFPESQIYAVLSPTGMDLFEKNPWNVQTIEFDKRGRDSGLGGIWRLARRLRSLEIDWCFSLHRYARTSLLAILSGSKEVYGFKEAPFSFFFTGRVLRKPKSYEAEKNLSVFQAALSRHEMDPVQYTLDSLYPELSVQEKDVTAALELLPNFHNTAYVIISPSSVWRTKRWPAERFAEIARELYERGQNVLIVGGKGEEDILVAEKIESLLASEIKANGSRQNWLKNIMGRTSISALRALIANAKLVLCNDSAPMHLATAFDRPCIAIFGPTTKELGFFPLAKSGQNTVIERRLDCRPCGLHGHKICPQGHFHCMLDIKVANVMQALESALCP